MVICKFLISDSQTLNRFKNATTEVRLFSYKNFRANILFASSIFLLIFQQQYDLMSALLILRLFFNIEILLNFLKMENKQEIKRCKIFKTNRPDQQNNSEVREPDQEQAEVKTRKIGYCFSLLSRLVYKTRQLRARKWYNYCYLSLTMVLILALTLQQSNPQSPFSIVSRNAQYVCHCGFILFVILRLASCEPIHLGWCSAQFIAFVSGLSSLFIQDEAIKPYLHTLSCMRALIIVRTTSLYTPFINFIGTFKNISTVVTPILILIYLFSIVGLYAFAGNYPNRCSFILKQPNSLDFRYSPHLIDCSQNTCSVTNSTSAFCIAYKDIQQILIRKGQLEPYRTNEGYEIFTYKNIFYSFYNTYRITFIAGWSKIASIQRQKTSQIFICFYYVIFLYLISYIYMNIFYGNLVVNEQQNNPTPTKVVFQLENQQNYIFTSTNLNKNERKSMMQKQINNEVQVFKKQLGSKPPLKKDLLVVLFNEQKHPQTKTLKYKKLSNSNLNLNSKLQLQLKLKQAKPAQQKAIKILQKDYFLPQDQKYRKWAKNFIEFYRKIDLAFIFICCLNMSIETEAISFRGCPARNYIDLICIGQVFLTLFMKLICYNVKKIKLINWCNQNKTSIPFHLLQYDSQLKFQIFISAVTLAGLIHELYFKLSSPFQMFPSCKISKIFRNFKYIRICKVLMQQHLFEEVKLVIKSIVKVLKLISSYTLFYLLILLLFSLIAFNMFQFKNQDNFDYSFKEVSSSLIYIFMIFSNDQQDSIFFQQYPIQGVLVIIFHTLCTTIGTNILSKYFLTLFLSQLFNQLDANNQRMKSINYNKNQKQKQKCSEKIINNRITNIFQYMAQDESKKQSDHIIQNSIILKQIKNEQQKDIEGQHQSFLEKFRMRGQQFIKSNYYIALHSVVTFICLIQVGFRHPTVDPTTQIYQIFQKIQICCSVFFIAEVAITMFCFGIFLNQCSYFRRVKANFISFAIFLVCTLNLTPYFSQSEIINNLCRLKFLRLLVLLNLFYDKSPRMKLTIISFINLIPKIIWLIFIIVTFYAFFAIILSSLFSHKYFHCANYAQNAQITNRMDCFNWGGDWVNDPLNADYSSMTIIKLVLVALTEGWHDIVSSFAHLQGQNLQPNKKSSPLFYLFCVVGYSVGSFIVLNVFIAYLLYQLKKITYKQTGQSQLTSFQKDWLRIKQQIYRLVLKPHHQLKQGSLRYYCNKIVFSTIYKIVKILYMCSFLILLSFLTSQTTDRNLKIILKTQVVYISLSFVFFIIQLQAKRKVKSYYNIAFHIFFYGCSIAFFSYLFITLPPITANIMMADAILISLQLIQYWVYIVQFQIIKKTLKYLSIILPRTKHILLLMTVVLLIYTFIAIEFFSYQKLPNDDGQFIQDYSSFLHALFTLIKFSTWQSPINQILDASLTAGPNFICFDIRNYQEYVKYGQNGCGSQWKSYLFFISFHIIYTMILHSALMANIFESYSQAKKQNQILHRQFQLSKVTNQWLKFDEKATGFISYLNFWNFTSRLYQIYSKSSQSILSPQLKSQFISNLNIKMYSKQKIMGFEFYETIEQLVRFLLARKYNCPIAANKADQIYAKLNGVRNQQLSIVKTQFSSKHVLSILILTRCLNNWRKKSASIGISNSNSNSTKQKKCTIFKRLNKAIDTKLMNNRRSNTFTNIQIMDI